MISLNWVMNLPKSLTEEQFEKWYLGIHTGFAKETQGIMRYNINRYVSHQPKSAHGIFHRVAQEWWEDFDAMEAAWNSHSGLALLGDGQANMGLDPGTLPGIAITEDLKLPVASPALFSTIKRGYQARSDGTISRVFGFGFCTLPLEELRSWYLKTFGDLGQDPLVREHVFGTSLGRKIQVGLLGSLPGEGQHMYDWIVELWFDSNDDARTFMDSPSGITLADELEKRSSGMLLGLTRGQEMMIQNMALSHVDE